MNNISEVVKTLIIINVIVYLGSQGLTKEILTKGMLHFNLSPNFQEYQIFTSMFMHANFMHLAFNMMSLYFLGPYVERALGEKRFLLLYLLSGLGATALHLGVNYWEFSRAITGLPDDVVSNLIKNGYNAKLQAMYHTESVRNALDIITTPALGASGCVYGVMIAFATMFPNLKLMVFPIPVPLPARVLGVLLVVFGLYSGFGGHMPGIAHFAHVGGAIVGFIMVLVWGKQNLH